MQLLTALLLAGLATCWGQDAAPADELGKLRKQLELNERRLKDWPALGRYRADNAKVPAPASGEERVVFMGDSITDGWGRRYGKFFPGKPYINRGIGGQTTPQMLLRFRSDVLAHKPKAVVILAGTNDIGGNTGPMTLEEIEGNLATMSELAKLHGIKVILSSVLPVCDYIRPQSERRPMDKIKALNVWIKEYAADNGHHYLDYFTPMLDDKGVLKQELTYDGLHPNDAGYEVMVPLALKVVEAALGR
ncbi:MAG: SGNH/GDSL hydrolase family protein [Bryobacterales bacterium]|nr:SGNH/GDSL hydrolase family protein [Bryobacterales bacterium]